MHFDVFFFERIRKRVLAEGVHVYECGWIIFLIEARRKMGEIMLCAYRCFILQWLSKGKGERNDW